MQEITVLFVNDFTVFKYDGNVVIYCDLAFLCG